MKKRFIKTPLVGVQVHGAKDVGTRTVNLLMGEHAGEYVRGDIMDANAVIQAFDEIKGSVDSDHDSLEEIVYEIHNLRDATNQNFEVFQEKIEEETVNRTQGDNDLDEKINAEKQERVNADTQLRNDLTTEVNRAKASENTLASNIQAEATKRENDDNTIKDNLNAEVTRATAKENEIKAQVDVINGDSATEGSFRKAIADVVGAAPEAYDTLKEIADKLGQNDDLHTAINEAIATKATTAALNEEITRSKAAEAENKADIAAEVARAKQAEGNNALAIQNEESRATLAENATNDALNTEIDRAKGQEAYIQNLVNTKADTTALEGAKTELDNKLAQKVDTTTLNEQVDALNTVIAAKQDAGNYIPYARYESDEYIMLNNICIENGITKSRIDCNCLSVYKMTNSAIHSNIQCAEIELQSDKNRVRINDDGISIWKLDVNAELGISDYLLGLSKRGIKLHGGDDNHVLTSNASTIDITEYALKSELPAVPTKVSQLQNDSEFIAKSVYDEKIAELEARIAALEAKHTETTA